MADTIKVPVYALRPQDVTAGSHETITSVSAGISTPAGKMDVVLENQKGKRRTAQWRRHTIISLTRVVL